jgi:4-hydroxy-2-oxoglutarate aldolase
MTARNPQLKETEGDLRGIFAALTTPFVGNDVSPEKLKENIERYNSTGLAGYVVLGSTGEAVFLSDPESERIVAEARASAAPGKRIIVGTSRESARWTIDFTNRMADLGAQAALVKPPHYYKSAMTGDVLLDYYVRVADKSKVPILIYNIPQNTGVAVEPSLVIELSRHPNIAGIKDSSGHLVNTVEAIPGVRPGFVILLGAGSVLWPGLLLGSSGGILAMAAAIPELCVDLYTHYREGRVERARKLQLALAPLNKTLTRTLGIPGLKYALDLLGYYGGPPRPPLPRLTKSGREQVRQNLEKLGLPASSPGARKARR